VGDGVIIACLNGLRKGVRRKNRGDDRRGGWRRAGWRRRARWRKSARWRRERRKGGYGTGHDKRGDHGQGSIVHDNRWRYDRRRGWRWCGGSERPGRREDRAWEFCI